MHTAYAILMTTPWVIGTLLVLAGIGAIVGKYLMEETLYRAGVRIYQEDKKKEDQEALEDLVNIFEEMLERIEARERQKQFKAMYNVAIRRSIARMNYPLPLDSLFDTSELRGRNAFQGNEVYGTYSTFTETDYRADSSKKGNQKWDTSPHLYS